VLAVVPGNLSILVCDKSKNCLWSLGKPKPDIQSCNSLKLFKFSSTKNDISRLPYVIVSPGIG